MPDFFPAFMTAKEIFLVVFITFGAIILSKSSILQQIIANRLRPRDSILGANILESCPGPLKAFPPELKSYQLPSLRTNPTSHSSMGLKRFDKSKWLTIDSNYMPEHLIRLELLQNSLPTVVQCLPGSEPACYELLDHVTSFLTSQFPRHFSIVPSTYTSPPSIRNHITNETHIIGRQCSNPLETCARLTMEDLSILIEDPESGEHRLMASATLFPAGWKLQERIGTTMAAVHGPVPRWKENFSGHINLYFAHITAKSSMERQSFFVQTTAKLFQDEPEGAPSTPPKIEDIYVRRERQTFMRLSKSSALVFTVRTFMQKLVHLDIEEVRAFEQQVRGWDKEMAAYKGVGVWGDVALNWCDEMLHRDSS
ncbi:hypothetical protein B7494_g1387 [Chlorociboria aeruginascens]|nr:hypothetical protein B7494_g1387 [Chlorociboria aeruginascens]